MKIVNFLDRFSQSAEAENWSLFLVRVTLAIVIFPHGAQLLLGWFDGFGYDATMQYFTTTANLPYLIGFLVIMIQFFGSIMLLLGLAVRLNAIAMFFLFVGMILTSHVEYGFFMNWYGTQEGEGYEYHLLVLGLTLPLVLKGSGAYGIGKLVSKNK